MKQRYVIQKNSKNKQLLINEFAELDKGAYTLVCEETFEMSNVEAAIKDGTYALVSALRTPSLYPSAICMEKIVESVVQLFRSENEESAEIFFNDKELMAEERVILEKIDEEKLPTGIDDLLEDDAVAINEESENHIDENEIKIISTIKLAEDETVDLDDEE